MGYVEFAALDGRRLLLNTDETLCEATDLNSFAVHLTHDGRWILYEVGAGGEGRFREISESAALDIFVDRRLEVPAPLKSLAMARDVNYAGLRHKPRVKTWPAGAADDEPTACYLPDGRWLLDFVARGERRCKQLTPDEVVRFFIDLRLAIPAEASPLLQLVPDHLAVAAARIPHQSVDPGAGLAPSRNEDRDRFCYEEEIKGTIRKEILNKVNSHHGWCRLGSPNAVKNAARRHAERHRKPLPLPRRRWP
jgi:hypothetical protein